MKILDLCVCLIQEIFCGTFLIYRIEDIQRFIVLSVIDICKTQPQIFSQIRTHTLSQTQINKNRWYKCLLVASKNFYFCRFKLLIVLRPFCQFSIVTTNKKIILRESRQFHNYNIRESKKQDNLSTISRGNVILLIRIFCFHLDFF